MRILAGFICAFLLFSGYSSPVLAAGKSGPAPQAKKAYSLSLTPTAGVNIFSGKENLKSGQLYALKFSYNFIGTDMIDSLGIDAIAGYIDTVSTVDNGKAKVYQFRVDFTYPFILKNSRFTPFLAVGAGGNLYERSAGTKGKSLAAYGVGLKYKLLDYLVARTDARHVIFVEPERDDNFELTAGLTYIFGVERKPKQPVDADNDGVPENLDKCPDTPKGVKVDKHGCPRDSDRDGVPDHLDKCANTPKGVAVDKKGCPEVPAEVPSEEKERDEKSEPAVPPAAPLLPLPSLPAADAAIAAEPGPGIVALPLVAEGATGKVESEEKKAAPAEPLRVSPEEAPAPAAPAAGKEAPAPLEAEQGYLLRFNVEFDFDKAAIRPRYHGLLRKAVNFLKTNPGTVAEIRGHTDSIGNADYNLLLSKRRAESVRRYLVKNSGIDASRVIVSGYGFHRPIADNRSAAGRQKNRRTEVTITIRKRGESPEVGTERGPAPKPGTGGGR